MVSSSQSSRRDIHGKRNNQPVSINHDKELVTIICHQVCKCIGIVFVVVEVASQTIVKEPLVDFVQYISIYSGSTSTTLWISEIAHDGVRVHHENGVLFSQVCSILPDILLLSVDHEVLLFGRVELFSSSCHKITSHDWYQVLFVEISSVVSSVVSCHEDHHRKPPELFDHVILIFHEFDQSVFSQVVSYTSKDG